VCLRLGSGVVTAVGPWVPSLAEAERIAQLGTLALACVYEVGSGGPPGGMVRNLGHLWSKVV
jgi:hypothetical protein